MMITNDYIIRIVYLIRSRIKVGFRKGIRTNRNSITNYMKLWSSKSKNRMRMWNPFNNDKLNHKTINMKVEMIVRLIDFYKMERRMKMKIINILNLKVIINLDIIKNVNREWIRFMIVDNCNWRLIIWLEVEMIRVFSRTNRKRMNRVKIWNLLWLIE